MGTPVSETVLTDLANPPTPAEKSLTETLPVPEAPKLEETAPVASDTDKTTV